LEEILQVDDFSIPYYYILNNNSTVDTNSPCFSQGVPENLTVSNLSISENVNANTTIGILAADTNYVNGSLIYYLTDFELDNDKFKIVGNELQSNESYDYETKNEFTIKLGVRNSLGEKLESEFIINIEDVINENVVTVEITDTILENIYYHQNSFTEPTKLVFTNLSSVNGYVYFHNNVNLVEVDFPLLDNTAGYFYFNGNSSLEIVNAPNLTSVSDHLYISGNTSLQQLNICNLEEILQVDDFSIPYYYILNNNSTVDTNSPCFSQGPPENLAIDNLTIAENQTLNSTIGALTADSNYANGSLTYYLTEFELDNDKFSIVGNELVTATPLDYETKKRYTIKLGVRNQLGEKIESEFYISVQDVLDETITIIEITDTTLENIYYHQNNSFITPTKLVFTNLTSVNGYVYFHNNVNLVEIDFPLLDNIGSSFYFNGNQSLEIVNAPNLNTIYEYLYVSVNPILETLNICSLTQILPNPDFPEIETYYYIRNKPSLDFSTTCLIQTSILFKPVRNIIVQPAPNTLVGTFSSDADVDSNIRYFFVDEKGIEVISNDFVIIGNNVYLAKEYEDYTETDFTLDINAIRVFTVGSNVDGKYLNNKSQSENYTSTTNNINEKIDLTFSLNIENTTLSINDFSNEKQIFLYPNPTKNNFYLNSKNNFNIVSIFDLTGRHIKTFQSNENKYDVSNLHSGTYLIKIEQKNDKSIYTKNLIIN
jgi:hypothetical protein